MYIHCGACVMAEENSMSDRRTVRLSQTFIFYSDLSLPVLSMRICYQEKGRFGRIVPCSGACHWRRKGNQEEEEAGWRSSSSCREDSSSSLLCFTSDWVHYIELDLVGSGFPCFQILLLVQIEIFAQDRTLSWMKNIFHNEGMRDMRRIVPWGIRNNKNKIMPWLFPPLKFFSYSHSCSYGRMVFI